MIIGIVTLMILDARGVDAKTYFPSITMTYNSDPPEIPYALPTLPSTPHPYPSPSPIPILKQHLPILFDNILDKLITKWIFPFL